MSNHVLIRPRQKVPSDDLNNMQRYKQSAIDMVVKRGITDGAYYTGFGVAKTGATEITVAAGEFWRDGVCYARPVQTVQDLFNNLPAVTRRIVTIVAWGVTAETDITPTDFLIDVDARTTEPQAVSKRETRQANIQVVPGAEAPSPAPPSIDAGVVAVAHILLDVNGVVSIEMIRGNVLPSVEDVDDRAAVLEAWRDQVGQRIDSIDTEIAAIKGRLPTLDVAAFMAAILRQLEDLRNEVRRPATAVKTWVDNFISLFDTDTAAAGYAAVVQEGLRFPFAATQKGTLTLLNAIEPKVKTVGDFTLPAWVEVPRLTITGADGELAINSYPVQTITKVQKTISRDALRYGDWMTGSYQTFLQYTLQYLQQNANFSMADWQAAAPEKFAAIDQSTGALTFLTKQGEAVTFQFENLVKYTGPQTGMTVQQTLTRWRRVFIDTVAEPYWDVATVESAQTGSIIGDVFLAANTFWATKIGVPLSRVAATGDVTVALCEVGTNGQPDEKRIIVQTTVAAANLQASGETAFPIRPTLLQGGRQYAAIVITSGNHYVKTVSGGKYGQSQLFYKPDTSPAWVPIANGDLVFSIYGASFSETRVEVPLEPFQLAGGITSLRIMAAKIVPTGTRLTFETQITGQWKSLDNGDIDALQGSPAMVAVRMVFVGTSDLMPGIDLTQTEWETQRAALALTHVSKAHAPGVNTNNVVVSFQASNYSAAKHTFGCKLVIAGSDMNPSSTVVTVDPADPNRCKVTATFAPASTASYRVKITAATNTAGYFPVITERQDSAWAA